MSQINDLEIKKEKERKFAELTALPNFEIITVPTYDYRAKWLMPKLPINNNVFWASLIFLFIALVLSLYDTTYKGIIHGIAFVGGEFSKTPLVGCHKLTITPNEHNYIQQNKCLCGRPEQSFVYFDGVSKMHNGSLSLSYSSSNINEMLELSWNQIDVPISDRYVLLSNPSFSEVGRRNDKNQTSMKKWMEESRFLNTYMMQVTRDGRHADKVYGKLPAELSIDFYRTVSGYCVKDTMKIIDTLTKICVYYCVQEIEYKTPFWELVTT